MVNANTNLDKVIDLVNKANEDIEKQIMNAQKDVELYIETGFDEEISERIEYLIEITSQISEKTIEKAAEYGIEVQCEYIEVEIGGTIVLIDPLRIVGV